MEFNREEFLKSIENLVAVTKDQEIIKDLLLGLNTNTLLNGLTEITRDTLHNALIVIGAGTDSEMYLRFVNKAFEKILEQGKAFIILDALNEFIRKTEE